MTDRTTVREGYDALGHHYADRRSPGAVERRLLERLIAPIDGMAHVLDAGCGPGPTHADLVDSCRIVGLDASRIQLDLAARALPDTSLVQGDLGALPFPDDCFDAVVSLGTLMHLTADVQTTVVDEFSRVIRPMGRLLVSDGAEPWRGENSDWLDAGVRMTWEVAGIEDVAADLERAGFELIDRETGPDELADDEEDGMAYALVELPL